MSRTYFRDLVNEPLAINNASVTLAAGTDTILFPAGQIAIQNSDVRPGKVWKLTASGIVTTGVTGAWIVTQRWGQLLSSPSLGVGGPATYNTPGSETNTVFIIEAYWKCATLGLGGGANSSVVGNGLFIAPATGTAGQTWIQPMGGGSAVTFDIATVNIAGAQISINSAVAGSILITIVTLEALN